MGVDTTSSVPALDNKDKQVDYSGDRRGSAVNLALTDEQVLLRDTFAEMFSVESSPERVRRAEPGGFDPALWKTLIDMGAIGMRVPSERGGDEASLMDALVVAEQLGRHVAPVPLIECMVTARLLARLDSSAARELCERMIDGTRLAALALHPARGADAQWVPGGAAAHAVVGLDGDALVLVTRDEVRAPPANLGASPLARWQLSGDGARPVLARGADATAAHQAAVEEWKLLTAAALLGLARRALEIGAAYAGERVQFDRPIAAFQGVAHPLADAICAVEGGRFLARYAIWALGQERADAAALISMAYTWSADAATESVARALHAHGGYGLSLEYDIQLYHRRAKAWALAAGDPHDELQRAFERRYEEARPALPDPGSVEIDFSLGEQAESFRACVRAELESLMTPELCDRERLGWEGCDFDFHRALARAGLLFPTWPEAFGGRGCGPLEARAHAEELARVGWPGQALATTRIVGETLMRFGTPELKARVLPAIGGGEAICCLGYTEPASGSDVAAATTRAVRDGDDWVIDGQKMFTSGANLGQYVFLLTRTDPESPKHRGLTLFLVPLETPGIEVHPIHTLSDERSNATYYSSVRVPDHFRVGQVNGGWEVMGYALHLEHGGGGASGFVHAHEKLVDAALAWARRTGRSTDPRVRERIARAATRIEVVRALGLASLWAGESDNPVPGIGPMLKLLGAESFIEDASALLDMAAPESLLAREAAEAVDGGEIEYAYRLSTATSIYGGTSEIMRSIVAQTALGMPRSRS
jgi:alkylation response protein AidB-like acyl-CoA dehydrogenase